MVEDQRERYTAIDSFTGCFSFLANTTPTCVLYNGRLFPSPIAALCVARYRLEQSHIELLQKPYNEDFTPSVEAKELMNGLSTEKETDEWIASRLKIMEIILRDKFRRHSDTREQLKQTTGRKLIWSNPSDSFFGTVDGKGENHLGLILMKIRNDIEHSVEFETWLNLTTGVETNADMRPTITLVESKSTKNEIIERHELSNKDPCWTIGSLPSSTIRPLNPSVSRRHAMIFVTLSGTVAIMDLKSTAGTYLDNKKLELDHLPFPLNHGSVIRLGASTRHYTVQINKKSVINYLSQRQHDLEKEIEGLSQAVADPASVLTTTEVRICVKNISFKTTKLDLQDFFEPCGEIQSIILPQPRDSKPLDEDSCAKRGIAFITFSSPKEAKAAVMKDGCFFNQRKLLITYAKSEQSVPFERHRKQHHPTRNSNEEHKKRLRTPSVHTSTESSSYHPDPSSSSSSHRPSSPERHNQRHERRSNYTDSTKNNKQSKRSENNYNSVIQNDHTHRNHSYQSKSLTNNLSYSNSHDDISCKNKKHLNKESSSHLYHSNSKRSSSWSSSSSSVDTVTKRHRRDDSPFIEKRTQKSYGYHTP